MRFADILAMAVQQGGGAASAFPGPELVTNGDFASADSWVVLTFSGGTQITGGQAILSDPDDDGDGISQILAGLNTAGTYRVVYTIASRTSGSMRCRLPSGAGISRNTTGTFTEDFVVSDPLAQTLSFEPGSGGLPNNIHFDDVSVKRVA